MKLDGKEMPGYDIKLDVQDRIESTDISGSSNASVDSHEGFKPALLNGSLLINHDNPQDLKALRALFHAEENGEPKIYQITEHTCGSMGILKVKFINNLDVKRDGKLLRWKITFNMKEDNSVPERKENRKKTGDVVKIPPPVKTQNGYDHRSGHWLNLAP